MYTGFGVDMFPTPLGKYQGTQLLAYTVSMLSFGEGHGNPLQLVLCLGNPMDRGAWWAVIPGVVESRMWLK